MKSKIRDPIGFRGYIKWPVCLIDLYQRSARVIFSISRRERELLPFNLAHQDKTLNLRLWPRKISSNLMVIPKIRSLFILMFLAIFANPYVVVHLAYHHHLEYILKDCQSDKIRSGPIYISIYDGVHFKRLSIRQNEARPYLNFNL